MHKKVKKLCFFCHSLVHLATRILTDFDFEHDLLKPLYVESGGMNQHYL